jgi:hypothetical protein
MISSRRVPRQPLLLATFALVAVWIATPRPFSLPSFLIGLTVALVVIGLGWLLAHRLGLVQAPRPGRLAAAFAIGALTGLAVLAVLVYLLVPVEPALATRLAQRADAPAWMPLALAIEAAVLEELVFRWLLFSLVLWLAARAWRSRPPSPGRGAVWTANLVSAAAFAAVHLPAWLAVVEPSTVLVTSVLALNLAPGLVLGEIFRRWGIEAAIAAHLAGDLVVQGLGPRLL